MGKSIQVIFLLKKIDMLLFIVDTMIMSFIDTMKVFIQVLKNWQVIVTTVLMLLVMAFANFIIKYKRKPKKIRPKKEEKAPKAPAATEEKSESDTPEE
ncbi:MAG: hypothetical protein MJ188_04925 [Treponema sp.]|nr:hypothetical protein [Treponema sp.]